MRLDSEEVVNLIRQSISAKEAGSAMREIIQKIKQEGVGK